MTKKLEDNLRMLESLVHSESGRFAALWQGHENIIRNQDRRLSDIEAGIGQLQEGLGGLSDGMKQLGPSIVDLNAKLDSEHGKYEEHKVWHSQITDRIDENRHLLDQLRGLIPPVDEQRSHVEAHKEFVETAQLLEARILNLEKALEDLLEIGDPLGVELARLDDERDGEFLDFLRSKFGDDFAAARVGHVDEEIPE